MKRLIALLLLALTLFALCIQGARWQFDRYETRHARNELIRANIAKPEIDEEELLRMSSDQKAWREIALSGRFRPETEILVRNRYFQERYGFGVVTLFESIGGKLYWVDRGWVEPGPDAQTPPTTKQVTNSYTSIRARVRIEDIENQVGGSVFAIPTSNGSKRLQVWNSQNSIQTEPIYFDLISSTTPEFNPVYPNTLPALSDGPHLAYTFQWLFFAGLVVFGFVILVREDRKVQAENA